MTYFFGISIIALVAYMIFKKLHNRYHEQLFRQRMFRLRDDLRNLAIDGKVSANCMEFDYIDFSISKAIEESYFITLFYISALEERHKYSKKKSEDYKELYDQLVNNIAANKDLVRIMYKKNKIIRDYLLGQSPLVVGILRQIASLAHSMFNFKEYIAKKLSEVNYFPELSGLSPARN